MSLKALNKQIETCRQQMEIQRQGTCHLLAQHRADATAQLQKVPLPVAIGLAFVGGIVVQRLFDTSILGTPAHAFLWKAYLGWQAYS
ncbi:hypothetical protein [Microbulbifer sp.]|uniref:hypothetical protein n=1 Tax=Microbulbifer sp. TaxID=1908541 RepID=UPI002590148D|nr:hypothetical protein [Microbulbifer sp.]